MRTLRRVLLAIAALLAIGGITISLLPYRTTVDVPSIAGGPERTADVSCRAPLVALVKGDDSDAWFDYVPDQGVVIDADHDAGGLCADSMQDRGILGVVLVMATTCFAVAGLARRSGGPDDDADHGDAEDGAGTTADPVDPDDRPTP